MNDATNSDVRDLMERILYEIKRVVVGQDHFLERVLIAMLQGISVQANQGATREELDRLVESGLALWPSA